MFLATAPANPLSNGGGTVIIAIIGAVILLMLFAKHKLLTIIAAIIAIIAATTGFNASFTAQSSTGRWIVGVIAFLLVYGLGRYLSKMLGGK